MEASLAYPFSDAVPILLPLGFLAIAPKLELDLVALFVPLSFD